jgi:hypothetical protein
MSRMAPELATVEPPPDPPMRQTWAFESLAKSGNGLSLLNRYMARAERLYHRALHALLALRKANPFPPQPSPESEQTTPSPTPSPSSIRVDPRASAASFVFSEQTNPSPTPSPSSIRVDPRASAASFVFSEQTNPSPTPVPLCPQSTGAGSGCILDAAGSLPAAPGSAAD